MTFANIERGRAAGKVESEIVMLRLPNGGTGLELARFVRPDHRPGSPDPMANEVGLRNLGFVVDERLRRANPPSPTAERAPARDADR